MNGFLLGTQPAVAVQTASGGIATNAANAVTASLTGPGSLGGTTTVSAVNGVATFTNLRVSGSGSFTLTFAASGLTPATSAAFTIAPLPATHLAVVAQPTGSNSGSPLPVQPAIALLDDNGSPAIAATTPVSVSISLGTGTLTGTTTVTPVNGVATFTNLVLSGSGQHVLRFTAGGLLPATTGAFVVLGPPVALTFETRRVLVNAGGTYATAPVLRDASGDVLSSAPNFVSRDAAVVTVDSRGVLTSVAKGQAVVRASVPGNALIADSMLVIVPAVAGTALYTSLNGFTLPPDSVVTVAIYMDTRSSGKRIASGQIDVRFTPGQLAYLSITPDATVAPTVNDGSASSGVVRLSFANPAGFDGVTPIARITFRSAAQAGSTGSVQLVASELSASDFTDLLSSVVQVTQAIVLR
jgi:hypothetical protein